MVQDTEGATGTSARFFEVLERLGPEMPALLGPQRNAFRAYTATLRGSLSHEDSETLGASLYNGRLAAARLASDDPIELEEYFCLEDEQERGELARQLVQDHYRGLVVFMASRFAIGKNGQYEEDRRLNMIGVGNLALVKCLDDYTHTPGVDMTPFITSCIRNSMFAEVMTIVRNNTGMSNGMQRILLAIDKEQKKAQRAGEEVDFLKIGERLGYPKERVEQILDLSMVQSVPLHELPDIPISDEGAEDAYSAVEDAMLSQRRLQQVYDTVDALRLQQIISPQEWRIFTKRFQDGLFQREVGDELGLAQDRVSAIERQLLWKIRMEIETPGYHAKTFNGLVESTADLLRALEIPIHRQTDVAGMARAIIDYSEFKLTSHQRETLHALLGTTGMPFLPKELAKIRGCTHTAINKLRRTAINTISTSWKTWPAERQQLFMASYRQSASDS